MWPACGLVHRNSFYPRRSHLSRCRRPDELIEIHTRIDLDDHHRSHCHHQHNHGHNCYNHNYDYNNRHRLPCTHNPVCNNNCQRQQIDNSNTTYINNQPTNAIGIGIGIGGRGGRLLNSNNDLLRDLYHANNNHHWGNRTELQIRALRDLLEYVHDVNQAEWEDLRWGNDQRFGVLMEELRRRRRGFNEGYGGGLLGGGVYDDVFDDYGDDMDGFG